MITPSVTAADVVAYVGVGADPVFAAEVLAEAAELVTHYVGDTLGEFPVPGEGTVPLVALDRAVIEVAQELYNRRKAPNGVAQFAAFDGAPVRVARDPMVGAYPILNRWVGGGFA